MNIFIEFLYIRISLGTKFQFKQTILIYWTKYAKKGYFRSETEKSQSCVCSFVLTYYILLTFLHGGRQTQRYFNVSSPSIRRDKKDTHKTLNEEENNEHLKNQRQRFMLNKKHFPSFRKAFLLVKYKDSGNELS